MKKKRDTAKNKGDNAKKKKRETTQRTKKEGRRRKKKKRRRRKKKKETTQRKKKGDDAKKKQRRWRCVWVALRSARHWARGLLRPTHSLPRELGRVYCGCKPGPTRVALSTQAGWWRYQNARLTYVGRLRTTISRR